MCVYIYIDQKNTECRRAKKKTGEANHNIYIYIWPTFDAWDANQHSILH